MKKAPKNDSLILKHIPYVIAPVFIILHGSKQLLIWHYITLWASKNVLMKWLSYENKIKKTSQRYNRPWVQAAHTAGTVARDFLPLGEMSSPFLFFPWTQVLSRKENTGFQRQQRKWHFPQQQWASICCSCMVISSYNQNYYGAIIKILSLDEPKTLFQFL